MKIEDFIEIQRKEMVDTYIESLVYEHESFSAWWAEKVKELTNKGLK